MVWDIKSILILVAGCAICGLWILFIQNYKRLNTAKFEIINKMERDLPYQPFNIEWEKLKNNKEYKDSTKLERFLPIMFIILYIVTIIVIWLSN